MNKTCRYVILFTLVFGVTWCSTSGFFVGNAPPTLSLFNFKPVEEHKFLKLLDVLDVEHDGTLDGIVQATQRAWLRPKDKERWDVPDKHEDKRVQVLAILDQLGCLQEIHASKKRYDYAFVLGALVTRVRSRLAYLLKEWKSGVRFDEIVVLGGKRPLHPKLESLEVLLDKNNKELPIRADWTLQGPLPTTEAGMIRMIFDQTDLPGELKRNVRIVFVETPMQQCADGSLRRPNTGDTVYDWLRTYEPRLGGSCLFISNQPYVGYQDSVMRTLLPPWNNWEVETIGNCACDDLPLAVHLDNIARWLYQERVRLMDGFDFLACL